MNLKPTNFCESARILHIVDRHDGSPSRPTHWKRQIKTDGKREKYGQWERRVTKVQPAKKKEPIRQAFGAMHRPQCRKRASLPAGMPPRCYFVSSRQPRSCSKITQTGNNNEIRILILRNWKFHPLAPECANSFHFTQSFNSYYTIFLPVTLSFHISSLALA